MSGWNQIKVSEGLKNLGNSDVASFSFGKAMLSFHEFSLVRLIVILQVNNDV